MTLISARSHAGGAAKAAVRLHRALRASGLVTELCAPCVDQEEPGVKAIGLWPTPTHARLRLALDQVPRWLAQAFGTQQFTTALGPPPLGLGRTLREADLVHLHWIGKGTLPLRRLARLDRPVVWTLHDMWPLTGGCHYDEGCGRFMQSCGLCPVLRSHRECDLSRHILHAKQNAYRLLNLTFVAPSEWMAGMVRAATVAKGLPVYVIPNAVDRQLFIPGDRAVAREALGLSNDAKIVAFAAMGGGAEPRKGFDLLQAAMHLLREQNNAHSLQLLVIGGAAPASWEDLPSIATGHLAGEADMAKALGAADVLILPSRQDNLPNTVAEALACGVPVVAFKLGGLPDLVQHQHNGYLAQPFDVADLARGIAWVLEDTDRHAALRQAARKSTARFEPAAVAEQHLALYQKILHRQRLQSS